MSLAVSLEQPRLRSLKESKTFFQLILSLQFSDTHKKRDKQKRGLLLVKIQKPSSFLSPEHTPYSFFWGLTNIAGILRNKWALFAKPSLLLHQKYQITPLRRPLSARPHKKERDAVSCRDSPPCRVVTRHRDVKLPWREKIRPVFIANNNETNTCVPGLYIRVSFGGSVVKLYYV